MIKCNVTACGTISNSAVEKQSKEGTPFISFSITIPIAGSDGSGAELQSLFPPQATKIRWDSIPLVAE